MSKYDRYARRNYDDYNDDYDESFVIAASPEDIEKWNGESYIVLAKIIAVLVVVVSGIAGIAKFF